ncbi:MAG: argininosuccinate lyase [Thermoflexales bacterium]|nr:argininosuccinate lyase [Thermoflexales bacterium]
MATSSNLLWVGRGSGELDALMKRFNESMPFDIRLWEADIRGSIAYARALGRAKLLTRAEVTALTRGLEAVAAEFRANTFAVQDDDEDIHTAVERRLREIAGPVAGKLHTGRSRNDQVATDHRLFCMGAIDQISAGLREAIAALLAQAEPHVKTVMPGYTHLQRAQPITWAQFCLAYVWQFARDLDRLADARRRTASLPLGSGALAGNPFAIDRAALAEDLGFETVGENSLDGVSDRDFVAELAFCGALIGVHLSRLAEDLVLYATSEFGFVSFAEAYSTGSSLMPQKKNPDAMELTRGKSGRLVGNLMSVLTLLKGLPMTYDKDMQEDKEPIFDTLDTLTMTLAVVAGALRTLTVNAGRMRGALDPAMLSTDVAEYLVRRGVPFREAHHIAGRAVALADGKGESLRALTLAEWRALSPRFGADIVDLFNYARSVASRDASGGTSPRAIREQIRKARKLLA